MSIARSFVILPFSIVLIQTFSKIEQKLINSWLPSSFPRCSKPLDQAKIEAIGFVEVLLPLTCSLYISWIPHIYPLYTSYVLSIHPLYTPIYSLYTYPLYIPYVHLCIYRLYTLYIVSIYPLYTALYNFYKAFCWRGGKGRSMSVKPTK